MGMVLDFLTRTRGRTRITRSDALTYLYLSLGTLLMFGPVVWLVFSSFKSPAQLVRFPPQLLPYEQETIEVAGYDNPLFLFDVTLADGSVQRLAWIGRDIGRNRVFVDPDNPEERISVPRADAEPVENVRFSLDNYTEGIVSFDFLTYLRNSLIVTAAATILTLIINSMAAFSLSKYQYRGRNAFFLIMISTLMVPLSVILVPAFLLITGIGWNNNLLGVIIPGAATPTGVFLLRQYMLTIPDELLDSARIDGASEWRIYAQVVLPLSAPALAVLAIFSIMWRWNDFLWPLIVLQRSDVYTLQVGLSTFRGDLQTDWHLILAMTVLTLLPITFVFAFLQKYVTTGIATTGMK